VSDVTAHGIVGEATTVLQGALQREVAYTVSLKVQPPPQNENYTIEKISNVDPVTGRKVYSKIEGEVDLIESHEEFRICILENVGDDGRSITDKCQFYSHWNIMQRIDVYIPVKIEVSKISLNTLEDYVEGEVSALVEIVDPPEDINTIKGPKVGGRSGADFVRNLVYKDNGGDNCPSPYAPIEFRERCRGLQDDVDKVQAIVLNEGRERFQIHPENPNEVVVPIRSLEDRVDENSSQAKKIGYARILLHFPPIAGNNYRLKIRLIKASGQEAKIRDKSVPDLHPLYLQTPTINIWKRIKIEMVALQGDIKYEDINWKVLKSAFADAFIEVEEPPPEKRYTITLEEWKRYLSEIVYRNWRKREWDEYSKLDNVVAQIIDLTNYSFPQYHDNIPGSGRLTPPDNDRRNPNRTTWTFLENISKRIFREKLGTAAYNRIRNPRQGHDIGVCVLIYRPPFRRSGVGGLSFFNKMFYLVSGGSMEQKFAHEFGHALFLNHGPTYFVRNADIPFTTRCETGGSWGPFWDEHDSEDMMTCTMSYRIENVEWHFCGLCLLKLRLYDVRNMIRGQDSTLRRTLYVRKPKVYWVEEVDREYQDEEGWTHLEDWLNMHDSKPERLMIGEELRLVALYPPEGVVNDDNIDYHKDLTRYDRGSWVSTNERVGRVRVRRQGNIWVAKIKITGRGRTEIKYRIRRDTNDFIESDPLVLEVS
jgi:hypothetical protein